MTTAGSVQREPTSASQAWLPAKLKSPPPLQAQVLGVQAGPSELYLSLFSWIDSSASATHPDAEPLEDEDGVEVVAGDDGVAARRVQRAAGHRAG